jgi:molecular chaperone GrpE
MMDRQVLFERLLDFIQSEPNLPEYLSEEPESPASFDPYQFVAEWIALRHEVKQQGKLLQASQSALQQALEAARTEKLDLQRQLDDRQKQNSLQLEREQKTLFLELLKLVDALEQAGAHWQEQIDGLASPHSPRQPGWKRWLQRLLKLDSEKTGISDSLLQEMLVSNQQGIDLIQRSLLDSLRQRQVIPIPAKGQPFDPRLMYAIGREETASVPENTVTQEVVRGYLWGEQVLREAQVIVAANR